MPYAPPVKKSTAATAGIYHKCLWLALERSLLCKLPCSVDSCCWPSSPSQPIYSHSTTPFCITSSCLNTCPYCINAAGATLDYSVHSVLMFSSTRTLVFLSIQDTLITCPLHDKCINFLPLSFSHHPKDL